MHSGLLVMHALHEDHKINAHALLGSYYNNMLVNTVWVYIIIQLPINGARYSSHYHPFGQSSRKTMPDT